MYLVFMGCELRSPHHILSYSSQKSNPVFPHHLFYTPLLSNSPVLFFLTPIRPLSPCPTLLGFLSAGLLSDREGFVRCQIPELRDQRQTKRLVTYCSILERQKMESLIDRDIAFFPLFYPSSSFTHSILLSGFSLFFSFCQSFPPPHPHPCCL